MRRKKLAWMVTVFASLLLVDPAGAGLRDMWKGKGGEKDEEGYVPAGRWEAYFRTEEGQTKAMRAPIEQYDDEDWLGLTFTEYSGPRIRLGVMKVENRTAYAEARGSHWRGGPEIPLAGIEELLSTALYDTHRFELVERKRLMTVLGEQDLGASGRISQPTAAEIGRVQGVEYLIYGVVNEWLPEKSTKGVGGAGGIGGAGVLGKIGLNKAVAEVAMSFSVADSTSGQILFQMTERAEMASRGVKVGGAGGIGGLGASSKETSPISYAVQACINKAVYKLAMWLKDRPWTGTVIKVEGSEVYINAGSDRGMEMGTRLTALAKGEELIDPETGLSLGNPTEAIGTLVVTTVREKFSVAAVLDGCEGLKAGDQVEIVAEGPGSQAAGGQP